MITEIGGTVGDIEILPFLEAIRQFRKDVGRDNVFYVHVTLVPYIGPSGEQKTKPTQHSVTELRSRGIQPDVIVCRCDRPIPSRLKRKISLLCDVPRGRHRLLRRRPDALRDPAGAARRGPRRLHLQHPPPLGARARPHRLAHAGRRQVEAATEPVRIGLVGKYINLPDAYLSVVEALSHGGYAYGAEVELDWIASDDAEGLLAEGRLRDLDGVVDPRWVRRARHRGQDRGGRLRPRARDPVPRPLPRHAGAVIEFARNVVRSCRRQLAASSTRTRRTR